jgi:hypothetical protein
MLIKKEPEQQPTNFSIIRLSPESSVMVDTDMFEQLNKYHWRPRKKKKNIYAIRRVTKAGKTKEISMHREIMQPAPDEEPHHINHNTLDNRKCNLKNVPHNNHPRH